MTLQEMYDWLMIEVGSCFGTLRLRDLSDIIAAHQMIDRGPEHFYSMMVAFAQNLDEQDTGCKCPSCNLDRTRTAMLKKYKKEAIERIAKIYAKMDNAYKVTETVEYSKKISKRVNGKFESFKHN